jgi:hypothetical protein
MPLDDKPDPQREARHRLLNSVVTLEEAAVRAYVLLAGPATTISEVQRNEMAESLSRALTLYSLSENRETLLALSREEIRGGAFTDGGRTITFKDGRPPITGLVVTRTALHAVLDTMKSMKDSLRR